MSQPALVYAVRSSWCWVSLPPSRNLAESLARDLECLAFARAGVATANGEGAE